MVAAPQELIVATVPLNVTILLVDCVPPKFVPVMVTGVPTAPKAALRELMVGVPVPVGPVEPVGPVDPVEPVEPLELGEAILVEHPQDRTELSPSEEGTLLEGVKIWACGRTRARFELREHQLKQPCPPTPLADSAWAASASAGSRRAGRSGKRPLKNGPICDDAERAHSSCKFTRGNISAARDF